MQHKVQLSTLLRIAIAKNNSAKFPNNRRASHLLTKALAYEAIEALKNCDHCETSNQSKKVYAENSFTI
jgi:hypothetical protein